MATNNKNFRVKNGLDVNGEINVSAVGGDEGGQINLQKPETGTTLSGNVSIDIYQNKIRIFDSAGTNRGAYIDLSAAGTGVGSNLLAGGGGGISNVVEDTTPQLGGDLDAQGYDITNLNSLTLDTTPTSPGTAAGTIYWDSGDGIPKAILNANVTIGLGQESIITVKNATGSTITKGTVVYINGAQGQMPTVALADADTEATSSKTFGFAAEEILDTAEGFVVTEGVLRGVNTASFTEGGAIWLSSTAGQYTQTIPEEPAHAVFLGYAVKAHASAGEIIVKIQNGYELTELHGVTIANTAATNDILQLNSSGIWVNANLATAGIANLSGATFTGNLAGTNLALSGKDIFSNTGTGAPTFTTYSSGVRTVFYDNVGGTSVGYSRGIDAGVLWDSIPAADAGMYFKWYGGETQVASLSGTGIFTATTIVGNTNASTITTGTIDNARTSANAANGASTIVSRNEDGSFYANGITGTSLAANSINLTWRFGLTNLATFTNATGSTVGTISVNGDITGASFTGSGSGLTSIPAANLSGTVAVANGGTGATTATDARTNLETPKVYSQGTEPAGGNIGDIWIDTDSTPAQATTFARFEASKTTSQSIADGTAEVVGFPVGVENAGGFTTTTDADGGLIITIPKTGRYSLAAYIDWAQNGINKREVRILRNGSIIWANTGEATSEAGGFRQFISVPSYRLTAADTISVQVRQDAGSATNVDLGTIILEYLGE